VSSIARSTKTWPQSINANGIISAEPWPRQGWLPPSHKARTMCSPMSPDYLARTGRSGPCTYWIRPAWPVSPERHSSRDRMAHDTSASASQRRIRIWMRRVEELRGLD